jgi:hypothetical protein
MNLTTKLLLLGAGTAAGFFGVWRVAVRKRSQGKAEDEKNPSYSEEPVEAASADSFPASDPPSWTGTTGLKG